MPRRKKKIENLGDCKRFLSRIILDVKEEKIDPNLGSKLAYMINIMRGLIQGDDLEDRIAKVEEMLNDYHGKAQKH